MSLMRWLLLFFLCLTCCQKNISHQSVNLNFHSEPSSLDPRLARDLPSFTVARMLYEGLFRSTENGIQNALALDYSVSEDHCTYRFLLRDAKWSSGEPVTAHDFESTWKSSLSPSSACEMAHLLFSIKNAAEAKRGNIHVEDVGIHALSEHELVVELEHPSPYFLEMLTHPIYFPFKDEEVTNGPFLLVKWDQGSELVVEKNPAYWDAEAVKLEKITITMIEDEHTELNMYENGELDWAGSPNSSIPPEALPSLKSTCPDELFMLPIAGTYCYKFNTQAPPFNCKKIRQAFSKAINRRELIDDVLQANQAIAARLIPPCLESAFLQQCDIDSPVALFEAGLEEMGWTKQTMPPVTLIFSRSEKHQKLAQVVQQQWNQLFGIKVTLQSYEWNVFLSKLAHREYQVGGRGWISEFSDPLALLETYKYTNDHFLGASNDTGWSNPDFIAWVDEAYKTTSAQERSALIAKAEALILQEAPIAPLYHSTACYLKKPYLKGVFMSKLCDLDFKRAYIED